MRSMTCILTYGSGSKDRTLITHPSAYRGRGTNKQCSPLIPGELKKSTFLANPQSTTQPDVDLSLKGGIAADRENTYRVVNKKEVSRIMVPITYFNFLSGAPPPTHQSTIHRTAFKLSSRPPLPLPLSAIALSVSNAFTLCKGLLCTSKVKALSLSDKVPDPMILNRKAASDEDGVGAEEDWKV